jgi:hypothetical protein
MRPGVQWFTALVQAGLDTRFVTERDVVAHATPAVMIAALPRDVLAKVFDAGLGSGKMTPESVLATVTTETLVEHTPASVTWACLAAVAERRGIAGAGAPSAADAALITETLRRAITAGLSLGVITPADIVKEVTPKVLLAQFPDALAVKLLEVSLGGGTLTPALVIETLGAEALAKHAPVQVWACLATAGSAIAAGAATTTAPVATAPAPAATAPPLGAKIPPAPKVLTPPKPMPVVEPGDDVLSVLIELDEAPKTVVSETKPVAAPASPAGKDKPREAERAKT